MPVLSCKTRGNTSPQGKPRVYFCCHPADFSLYFPEISEEILALQNCALYYPENGIATYDEALLADLTQMQLFVMPISQRLLSTENPVLSVAYPFALSHYIPVLPLMQEPGLDALFNEKCGNRQYLDKHSTDQTALRYEDKLKTYLEQVLVNDELAEQIRNAFDAYLFLSYRKKDRRHAQELMRLIHERPAYQDVAIWYDEFLTPGENFNENIRAALQKSSLFVLTVTPNLVNEINYVMTNEYPTAKQWQKPVLAAEMIPTDEKLLSVKYPELPVCTNAHDRPAFSLALQEQLAKLGLPDRKRSPEHQYLIGLAYLSGIDVEVDHTRAVKSITSAAEAGYVPAVEKLIWMYRNGIGVERCISTSFRLHEQLASIHKERCTQCPTVSALEQAVRCFIACGDDYEEYGYLDKATEKYRQALTTLNGTPFKRDITVRRLMTLCYERLGNICKRTGALSEAKSHYQRAIEYCEALLPDSSDSLSVSLQQELAGIYNEQAYLCHLEGNRAEAKALCRKGLQMLGQLTGDFRQDIVACHDRLGLLCQEEGSLTEAEEHYQQSYTLCVAAVQENDSCFTRRSLAMACSRLGWLYQAQGLLDKARQQYQNAYNLREALVRDMASARTYSDLALAANSLGMVCQLQQDNSEAIRYFKQAVSLCENILPQCPTPELQYTLGTSYFYLATMSPENLLPYLQKAHALFTELTRQYPQSPQYKALYDITASALGG